MQNYVLPHICQNLKFVSKAFRKISTRSKRVKRLKPTAFKDTQIRKFYNFVKTFQIFLVCMKTIQIFHHKFTTSQKSAFWTFFISKFCLYLIRKKWQIPIRAHIVRYDRRYNLFMRP